MTTTLSEFLSIHPLQKLIDDESVTEILIQGPENIFYEKAGQLHAWQERFETAIAYRNFFLNVCAEASSHTSLAHPFANGQWLEFRVHVADLPCSSPCLTLRRQSRETWSLQRLADLNWCTLEQAEILHQLFASPCNGLLVGSTGSGKTSVLNAILQQFPKDRRVVIIEDTHELQLPNNFSCRLLTSHDPVGLRAEVTQQDLLKQSLRMRPDSIVMGEVRGAEAKDLLMAWSTGHSHCWSTLHADSARQALLRLEMLIQLGAPQWSLASIRQLIMLGLKYIVVVHRSENGKRELKEISRLAGLEENGILLETL